MIFRQQYYLKKEEIDYVAKFHGIFVYSQNY